MLGWEFPPHISGGLGTACLGLTRGLAHHGVEVTFVVPRAFGDEEPGPERILGADQIPVPVVERVPVEGPYPPAAPPAGAPAGPEPEAFRLVPIRVVTVASPLSPYLTAAAYREWASAAAVGAHGVRPEPEGTPTATTAVAAWEEVPLAVVEPPRGPERVQVSARPLRFTGFYGPDLMAEVARYAAVVSTLASRESFDVVHAHDWMTYPAAVAVARAANKPLVVHVHACEYDRCGEDANGEIVEIERRGLAAADRVICVSHYTAAIVARRYGVDPAKVRVVHNAVTHKEQVEGWHVEKTIDEPIVLFLGRVTFQKGPVYFLEAAARVVKVEPHVKFVMGGSGDLLPQVIERAASMGLARHVHFTGFLSGEDVERMYAMADVYVMPSVSEPFGIAPLEAMALDVPAIVSRQSGVAEVLRHALKFDYWDVDDLANKILAVLKRPALREHLTTYGREEVKAMRWEARAARVGEVYREIGVR